MSISKGAFGQSVKGGFIESPMGARGWGIFPIFTSDLNTSTAGNGARSWSDDGTQLVNGWTNQSGNRTEHVQYDDTHVVFSYRVSGASTKIRYATREDGTTVWTREVTEAAVEDDVIPFIRGDKIFYSYNELGTGTEKYRAVDRETGATVLWTVTMPVSGGNLIFYVDSNQDTYILYNQTAGFTDIRLRVLDEDGVQVSDVSIVAGSATNEITAGQVATNTYLVPYQNDFVIGTRLRITGAGARDASSLLRFSKDGTIVYHTDLTTFYNLPAVHCISAGRVYYRVDTTSSLRWASLATGVYIDEMSSTAAKWYHAAAPTDKSDELYLAGPESGTDEVARVNITSKTIVWQDNIVTGGTIRQVRNLVSRPWPA